MNDKVTTVHAQAAERPPQSTKGGKAEEIASRIEADINAGLLVTGSWLKQINLEKRYGCSRIDVRQALESLTARRLVHRIPNRGYYVSEFNERRLRDVAEVRVILEVAAVDDIIDRATPASVYELGDLAEAFNIAINKGDRIDQNNANLAFHGAMLELCTNRELVRSIMDLRRSVPVPVQKIWTSEARVRNAADEHLLMVKAIERRDRPFLRRLVANHIAYYEPAEWLDRHEWKLS